MLAYIENESIGYESLYIVQNAAERDDVCQAPILPLGMVNGRVDLLFLAALPNLSPRKKNKTAFVTDLVAPRLDCSISSFCERSLPPRRTGLAGNTPQLQRSFHAFRGFFQHIRNSIHLEWQWLLCFCSDTMSTILYHYSISKRPLIIPISNDHMAYLAMPTNRLGRQVPINGTFQRWVAPGWQTDVYYILLSNVRSYPQVQLSAALSELQIEQLPWTTSWKQLKEHVRTVCSVERVEVFPESTHGWVRLRGRDNYDAACSTWCLLCLLVSLINDSLTHGQNSSKAIYSKAESSLLTGAM